MTAITATVSAVLEMSDAAQIKSAIEAIVPTGTISNTTYVVVQGSNGKSRVVQLVLV